MLSDHFPRACRRYTSLPLLGSLADGFHTWLLERGFRYASRKRHLGALWRIDRALRRRGRREWADVTRQDFAVCWRQFRRHSARPPATVRWLQQFVEQHGWLKPAELRALGRVDTLTGTYVAMLGDLRGLAPLTIQQHAVTAAAFLKHLDYEARPAHLACLSASDVEGFVRRAGAHLSRATLQHTVARLRSFLRFLAGRTWSRRAWTGRSTPHAHIDSSSFRGVCRGRPCARCSARSIARPRRACGITRCCFSSRPTVFVRGRSLP
jgi:integrase/recombinase XerD